MKIKTDKLLKLPEEVKPKCGTLNYIGPTEDIREFSQGCLAMIEFPLGKDEVAIGKAINSLLEEGWKFHELKKCGIVLRREWRA